jgi:hypothetical protein
MTFRIIRGGESRKRGRMARDHVDRELHGVVLASTDHLSRVPDPSLYDLRRQRTRPYGGLLYFIDRCVAMGTPYHVVAVIPGVIAEYIRCAYEAANRPTDRAA